MMEDRNSLLASKIPTPQGESQKQLFYGNKQNNALSSDSVVELTKSTDNFTKSQRQSANSPNLTDNQLENDETIERNELLESYQLNEDLDEDEEDPQMQNNDVRLDEIADEHLKLTHIKINTAKLLLDHKYVYETTDEWREALDSALSQTYEIELENVSSEIPFEQTFILKDTLLDLCLEQLQELQVQRKDLADSLSYSLQSINTRRASNTSEQQSQTRPLDLGAHTIQILKKRKLLSYRDIQLPVEIPDSKKLIIRTGEFSGQFMLQVCQKLTCQSFGQDPDFLQHQIDKLNFALKPTKQKAAVQETRFIITLLIWLTVGIVPVFLSFVYQRILLAFVFLVVLLVGAGILCRKLKGVQNEDTQIRAHCTLSMACRALNYQERHQNQKQRKNGRLRFRPGYLAKWVEVYLP